MDLFHYLYLRDSKHDEFQFDCSTEELNNCFQEIEKEGAVQSLKRVSQGDHFYRSDTGRCDRCYRYRPEIHWNNENLPASCENKQICDRCRDVMGLKLIVKTQKVKKNEIR